MNKTVKKIFLGLSIALPFLIYCVYYYSMMIRNAPYRFSDFDSIVFQYGNGDSLINKFDSRTGDYQYVDVHNKLIKTHLHLNDNELLYLHRKAAELGFWNFPDDELNDSDKIKGINPPHYLIEYNYKHKSKKVMFDAAFQGDPKLIDANQQLIKIIQQTLDDAGSGNKSN
jgi:hypothetical protein